MHAILERIRKSPTFPPAIAAPVLIMLIFSLFNLTAPVDPSRLPGAITIGIVNEDAGLPLIPIKISDMMLQGMSGNLPFHVRRFDDQAAARDALEHGEVSAVLDFPVDFTPAVTNGGPVTVKIINSQHLTVSETQLAAALPAQLQGMMSAAIASLRLATAQGRPPSVELPVKVEVETLHTASGPAALAAPVVMVFATWLSSFVGAMLFFGVTRPFLTQDTAAPITVLRSVVPLVVTGLASLLLSLVVASAAHLWGSFFPLWGLVWLAAASITLLLAGVFAVLGFWAIVIVLPLVFYQSILGGAQAPVAMAPDWLRWLGEALPFSDLARGYRAVVIGGPTGSAPILLLLGIAVLGVVLIAAGTFLKAMLRRPVAAAGHA